MSDAAALIVAFTGLLGLASAWVTNRRGERSKARQQSAADELAARAQKSEEYRLLIGVLREEVERGNTAREADRTRHAAELHRRDDAHTAELRRTRNDCSDARARLASQLAALLDVVRDEVAREAARTVLARDTHHQHPEETT